MSQKILVLEDNIFHLEAMCKILEGLSEDIIVYRASSTKDAYRIMAENTFQLLILDIILDTTKPGDVSGLELARTVRESTRYKHTPIIFTTSVEDPKLYSYSQLHCFEYIEKPYDPEQVRKTVLAALEMPKYSDDDRYVSFQKDRILYSVRIGDIVYIRISRRNLEIHCVNDVLEIPYIGANEILNKLDSESFLQCSRYYIVNRTYIEQIDYSNRYIKMRNVEEQIEIGTVMKSKFKEKMDKWFREQ